jgi:hypothetical protein
MSPHGDAMSVTFGKETEIRAVNVWENDEKNVLAILWRPRGAATWTFDYRFRYFVDDKVFDSADEKSRYRCSDLNDVDAERAWHILDDAMQAIEPDEKPLRLMYGRRFDPPTLGHDAIEIMRHEAPDLWHIQRAEKRA